MCGTHRHTCADGGYATCYTYYFIHGDSFTEPKESYEAPTTHTAEKSQNTHTHVVCAHMSARSPGARRTHAVVARMSRHA